MKVYRLRELGFLLAISTIVCMNIIGCTTSIRDSQKVIASREEFIEIETPVINQDWVVDSHSIVAAHETVINEVYTALLPSVVELQVTHRLETEFRLPRQNRNPSLESEINPFAEQVFRHGEGSGFVWDEQGHIVTNHHVVSGAHKISVTFSDGSVADAEIIGSDPDSDLAVLKIDASMSQFVAVTLGDSDKIKVGQLVIAIGNPFSQSFSVTTGIISASERIIPSQNAQFSIPSVIQTDTAMNPGNSGGPLLDRFGHVIGINTQIMSHGGSNVGIGFAVPVAIAKKVVPSLISHGYHAYSFLGIAGLTLRPDVAKINELPNNTRGVIVVDIIKNGPAESAGIRKSKKQAVSDGITIPVGGDVIVGIGDVPIITMGDLLGFLIEHTNPGDKITLDVLRSEVGLLEVDVSLGNRP